MTKTREDLIEDFQDWLAACQAENIPPEEIVAEGSELVLITDPDMVEELRDEGRVV